MLEGMNDIDITRTVDYGSVDDELLPLYECACGEKFESWTFVISIYRDTARECPNCGRKMYFRNRIVVFEVVEEE